MKTLIRYSHGFLIAVVIATTVFISADFARGQFFPPLVYGQNQWNVPHSGAGNAWYSDAVRPLPPAESVYPGYTSPGVNIQITPIAAQGANSPIVQRQGIPSGAPPQEVPGMVAQTIYYFPPPTFPDPIPITVYRPADSQFQDATMNFGGMGAPNTMGNPQFQSNSLYGAPMMVQRHYFGPPPQQQQPQNCEKIRSRRAKKQKDYGNPGQPVVGPPTLVYPNGIVVRSKVYLPQQPFKNAIRGITP